MIKTLKLFASLPLCLIASLIFCSLLSTAATAGGVYQKPDEFIKQVFNGTPPKAEALWLNKDLKKQIAVILDHNYKGLRVRYWQQTVDTNRTTAWVLDEVGKEKPITTGIVINNGKIQQVKVLVFRESRGWEVRHNFFTDQFKQIQLEENNQLSSRIDNISGATLSVRAVRKMAQIALLLDKVVLGKPVQKKEPTKL